MIKEILFWAVLFCLGVVCGGWFIFHKAILALPSIMEDQLTSLDQVNVDNPDSLVPLFGPYEKFEHATLLVEQRCAEYKSVIFDFSRWDSAKVIGVYATAPDVQGTMGIIRDKTVIRFGDENLCYWL